MPSYQYTAVDKAGKKKMASMEAENEMKVSAQLKSEGLIPIEIKEQGLMDKDIDLQIFKKKVSVRDLSVFCRQFVSMNRAGVTILETLKLLTEQTENPTLKEAAQDTYLGVQKGDSLAVSMKKNPGVFPELLIHMVTAGEASGSLDIAFERMADQFEKSARLQAMVKKAMVYPIMVLIVAFVVVIVMLAYVVPTFMEMFADMEIDMPKITLMVVAASDFVKGNLLLIIGIVVVLVVVFMWFKRTPVGQGIIHKIALKAPLFGNLTTKSSSAKFARTLSTMLAAGIPMPQAVEITGGTINNLFFKNAMMDAKSDVMQGVPLSQPLERCGLFPPMVYHMTRIGEETGNIEEMLDTLADYYDEEVEVATQSLMAALEPLIIIFLAGICGVIIGAVIAPMGAMYSGLENL